MGLFRKGKTRIIAKFRRTDLVIYSHSREGKTLSYSRINMVPKNTAIFFMKKCASYCNTKASHLFFSKIILAYLIL